MSNALALASITFVCGCGWPLLAQQPQQPVPTAAWAPKPITSPAYPLGHQPWVKLADLKARHKGEASWTEDAKRQLHARIETLYARLAKHTADLEHAERATQLRALRRDEIAARAEQAVATRLDVAMAQVLQAEAMQDQAKIRDELASVEGELRRMIGAVEPVTFAVDSTALQVMDTELDRAVLTERAMASRPELRAAHSRIVEAQSEAYIARSEAWPWFDWAQAWRRS